MIAINRAIGTATRAKWNLEARGAMYLRVSKGIQQKDKDDDNRQVEDIGHFLADHEVRVAPDDVYSDVGSRSDAPDRVNFQRLLREVEKGRYRWIVVDRQDRFGTFDADEWGYYRYLLRKNKCDLYMAVGSECLTTNDLATLIKGSIGADASKRELEEKSSRSLSDKIIRVRRGEWPGGHISYACDLCCYSAAGEFRWRLTHNGRQGKHPIRIKVTPDGESQTYTGEYAVPAREHGEYLAQRPSADATKLDTLRKIFSWFGSESVQYPEIARRLHRLGIKPTYGQNWRGHDIWRIVRNKIYIGIQTFGKSSRGDHFEITGGRVVPRQTREFVTRDESEWTESDPMFEPMVPRELWDKVQTKLAATPAKKRAPASPKIWLRGLVTCSGCGKAMRGVTHGDRKKHPPEYICSAYSESGHTGEDCTCLRNGVQHQVLEKYVRQFLAESGRDLRIVLDAEARGDMSLLAPLKAKQVTGMVRLFTGWGRMLASLGYTTARLEKFKRTGNPSVLANLDPVQLDADVETYYRQRFIRVSPALKKRLATLDAEHTARTQAYAGLAGERAKLKANAEILELERQMDEIEGRLKNAADETADARREIVELGEQIEAAEAAIDGSDDRRTAEAVRQVIERIECTFEPTGKKCPTSQLVEVVIFPKSGGSQRYPHVPSPPARNCTSSGRSGSCWTTGSCGGARWTTGRGCDSPSTTTRPPSCGPSKPAAVSGY